MQGKEIITKVFIDLHDHFREPGQSQKETIRTGTEAALAGGYLCTAVMPNTNPPIVDRKMVEQVEELAIKEEIRTDLGIYLGVTKETVSDVKENFENCVDKVLGLKVYMGDTTGGYIIDDDDELETIFGAWNYDKPILVHTEGNSLKKALKLAEKYNRTLYVCHVSTEEELELIEPYKDNRPEKVFAEVTPHHLFLTDRTGRDPFRQMKPSLSSLEDKLALWKAVRSGLIDTIGTDHAPHTIREKIGVNPPFGVPGLETTAVLLLQAEKDGLINREQITKLTHDNPIRIFNLDDYLDSYVEFEEGDFVITREGMKSKCGWTPFEGWPVSHKIKRVVWDGFSVFEDGKFLVEPGCGRIVLGKN